MWLEKTSIDELTLPLGMRGELGSMNSNGWCRRPTNTNMRNRMGKGSTEVVDAINGFGAVSGVLGIGLDRPVTYVLKDR